jgi:hypothetical protein
MFQRKGGGGEGDLTMVWIFSLSLKTCTMEEIEGEELVYILDVVIACYCYRMLYVVTMYCPLFYKSQKCGEGGKH